MHTILCTNFNLVKGGRDPEFPQFFHNSRSMRMDTLQRGFLTPSSPYCISEGRWARKPFEGGAGMVPHRRGEESEA